MSEFRSSQYSKRFGNYFEYIRSREEKKCGKITFGISLVFTLKRQPIIIPLNESLKALREN
jgi:hypothetical protein